MDLKRKQLKWFILLFRKQADCSLHLAKCWLVEPYPGMVSQKICFPAFLWKTYKLVILLFCGNVNYTEVDSLNLWNVQQCGGCSRICGRMWVVILPNPSCPLSNYLYYFPFDLMLQKRDESACFYGINKHILSSCLAPRAMLGSEDGLREE